MNYEIHLKELRNKLASQQLSLMVGSGLSKNVNDKFLSWDELLVGLAYNLHQDSIEAAYTQHVESAVIPQIGKKDFVKAECTRWIRSDGYLDIVSAYIKWKGFPESITTYIEERIPGIILEEGKIFIDLNGTKEEVPKDALGLHRALIDMPWNNIYTTNYDDLIDICIDHGRYERLQMEIKGILPEIQKAEEKISAIEQKLKDLMQPEPEEKPIPGNPTSPGELSDEIEKTSDQINPQKWELGYQKSMAKQQVSKLETLFRTKESELNKCYKVVKNAADLRIKKQKNIIKLHGSLRSREEQNRFSFEFDGDHKMQYVIAREDFESYPTKHEAFTQLMRITLLQESFCLLGFSGDDPNFREWINWVRDILHKAAKKEDEHKKYKIYLVEASQEPLPIDLQLFYENHNILRIPLLDPSVIAIIQNDLGRSIKVEDRRQSLEAFISYLNNHEEVKVDIPSANTSLRQEYRLAWNDMNILDLKKIPTDDLISPVLDRLEKIEGSSWIPTLDYITHNQWSLVKYLSNLNWKAAFLERPLMLRLIGQAIQGLFLPIRDLVEDDIISTLQEDEHTAVKTTELLNRNDALSGIADRQLPNAHDEVLRLAYSLRFTELAETLKGWKATGKDVIIKAGFLALFDAEQSVSLLESAIWSDDLDRGEEMLYGLELLHFLTMTRNSGNDLRIARFIKAFKNSGFKLLQDAIESLQKQIERKRTKQQSYGQERFSVIRSMHFSNHPDSEWALQMIMLLAESGFQLTIGRVYLQSHDAWYPVMKAGYRFYPLAFLFYTLQYSNKEFLKKVGQDYAFSDNEKISGSLPSICDALFKGLKDAPESIQEHIPDFLSGLIVGVAPEVWQDGFSDWWKYLMSRKLAFENEHSHRHPALINAAVLYIKDFEILYHLMSDCLKAAMENKDDQPNNILFHLNRNLFFKTIILSQVQVEHLRELINQIINQLCANRINLVFVLGNLFRLLSSDQKMAIQSRLHDVDMIAVDGSRVWRIIVYFAKGDQLLEDKVMQVIANHRLLWHTGINGDTISGGGRDEYIPLVSLSARHSGNKALIWNDEAINTIYRKMVPAVLDIDRIDKGGQWFSFTDILEEMVSFLTDFEPALSQQDDYYKIRELTQKCLEKSRNYKDIEEGLTSQDQNEVLTAMAELSNQIYQNIINTDHVQLILNKILLQAEPALEACISYVSSWIDDKRHPERFKENHSLLERILKKYDAQPLEDADDAFVEENLVRIGWHLSRWDTENEIGQIWLKKGRNSKFNNVLQFISQAGNVDWLDKE